MLPRAIFFGSIGCLSETSEIERLAYNRAFAEAELDWHWSEDAFLDMLAIPGGAARIADYARQKGDDVDAEEVLDAQEAHFEDLVMDKEILPRPGVRELIDWSQAERIPLGFASTMSPQAVSLILGGLAPEVLRSDFAYIGDAEKVATPKPAPDVYKLGLQELDVLPSHAIAIEDTPRSAQAALDAGIATIGFPGAVAETRAFPDGVTVARQLTRALFDLPRA